MVTMTVSNTKPQTHSSEVKAGETVGGGVCEGETQGNRERRVECPSSHDIIQMALSLGPT